MTSERQVLQLDGEPVEINAHNCFACGTLNTNGLRLDLHLERGRAWTELDLDDRFEGWEGIAHGGIVATLLDEVMAWSLVSTDAWGVTARMAIDFRRPVRIGERIRAEGALLESRRRLFQTSARLETADGTLLASATGTYLAAPDDRRRELQEHYGFRGFGTTRVPTAEPADRAGARSAVGAKR
ncbi:MAG TPA: PaaI family thioesterase [Candidatus Limnocylindrales bacterium]